MKVIIVGSEREVSRVKKVVLQEFITDYNYELRYMKHEKIVNVDVDGGEYEAGIECVMVFIDGCENGLVDIPF